MTTFQIRPGKVHPLGATPDTSGVNFSLYSQYATQVELLLFDSPGAEEPVQVIKFDKDKNRTFFFWHCYVSDLKPGWHYA